MKGDKPMIKKRLKEYFNKKVLRMGFLVIAIYTVAVFIIQGNIAPAYVECLSVQGCDNPFYGATGKVCDYNSPICDIEALAYKQTLGDKPNILTKSYNAISWILMAGMFYYNHRVYKNGKNRNKN